MLGLRGVFGGEYSGLSTQVSGSYVVWPHLWWWIMANPHMLTQVLERVWKMMRLDVSRETWGSLISLGDLGAVVGSVFLSSAFMLECFRG